MRSGKWPKFRSIAIDNLPMLELRLGGRNRGTIVFEPDEGEWDWSGRSYSIWVPSLSRAARFFEMERPRQVYELIHGESERCRRELLAPE